VPGAVGFYKRDVRGSNAELVVEETLGWLLETAASVTPSIHAQQPVTNFIDVVHHAAASGLDAADPLIQARQQPVLSQPRQHPLGRSQSAGIG